MILTGQYLHLKYAKCINNIHSCHVDEIELSILQREELKQQSFFIDMCFGKHRFFKCVIHITGQTSTMTVRYIQNELWQVYGIRKKFLSKACPSRWRGFERWQATLDSGLHRALPFEKRKPLGHL